MAKKYNFLKWIAIFIFFLLLGIGAYFLTHPQPEQRMVPTSHKEYMDTKYRDIEGL